MKTCKDCKKELEKKDFPIKDYRTNLKGVKIQYRFPRCHKCHYQFKLDREVRNRERKRQTGYTKKYCKDYYYKVEKKDPGFVLKNRLRWVKSKYGITKKQYFKLLEDCNGICPICLQEEVSCVDHCHTTNKVRGLLCVHCNLMLGHARDNVEILFRGIVYLEKY